MKHVHLITTVLLLVVFIACKKEQSIRGANYPNQLIYLPSAVEGNSINGIYAVNKLAVLGQGYRYIADVTNGKLNIPLTVYRSGVNKDGAILVNVAANTDTVNTLITASKLPVETEILPLSKYALSNDITIADGKDEETFMLQADLDFLLTNLTKKFAIGIGVSSQQVAAGKLNTTVLLIDPAFLVPVANFTTTITGRTVNFINNSLQANQWLWNYGDGSATSTLKVAAHTYTNPGNYTITLTAFGALGNFNKSIITIPVVIP